MNILFICKWNRFRSKVAEAIFNKLNKNPSNKAKSAGLIAGSPLDKDILNAAKKFELKLPRKRQGLSHKLLMWADEIIIVASDVPISIFEDIKNNDKKKIVNWNIVDYYGHDNTHREKLIESIKSKIELLLKEIS